MPKGRVGPQQEVNFLHRNVLQKKYSSQKPITKTNCNKLCEATIEQRVGVCVNFALEINLIILKNSYYIISYANILTFVDSQLFRLDNYWVTQGVKSFMQVYIYMNSCLKSLELQCLICAMTINSSSISQVSQCLTKYLENIFKIYLYRVYFTKLSKYFVYDSIKLNSFKKNVGQLSSNKALTFKLVSFPIHAT